MNGNKNLESATVWHCLQLYCVLSYLKSNMKGVNTMGKTLVTYFSVSGVSKAAAERIAKYVDADIAEIAPKAR